jgi:hypothetical protein
MSAEQAKRTLLSQRDLMLRNAEALRNRIAGLDMAIEIVREEIEASGMSAFGQDAEERLEAKPASPAPQGETP